MPAFGAFTDENIDPSRTIRASKARSETIFQQPARLTTGSANKSYIRRKKKSIKIIYLYFHRRYRRSGHL
jgi:hypothetical protein